MVDESGAAETCWTLIRDAASGTGGARDRFAHVYLDLVRAYLGARWRSGSLLARLDDAVQDVFLECFRADGALSGVKHDGRATFRTFLYAVVRNVARRHEESLGRKGEGTALDDIEEVAEASSTDSPSRVFDREWARAIVRRARERQHRWAQASGDAAVRRLEILRLRFEDGLPIRDIAERWRVDADNVHAEYRRARTEFKEALREEVGFHLPASTVSIDAECVRILKLLESS